MITFLTDSSFHIIYYEWFKVLKKKKKQTDNKWDKSGKNVSFLSLNFMISILVIQSINKTEICICWGCL